jgi:hypothetical protein
MLIKKFPASDQEIGHPCEGDDEENDADLGELEKTLVRTDMLGVVHRRMTVLHIDAHVMPPVSCCLNDLVTQQLPVGKP